MTKRLLTAVLVVVMLVSCMLPLASCKKHSHDYKTNVTATCTAAGETIYTCSCGDSYSEYCGPLGHAMTTKGGNPAGCTTEGYEAYQECSRCGYTTKSVESATGHYFIIDEVVYPTYNEAGSRKMTCTVCGEKVTEKINAISVYLPSLSELLAGFIGETSTTISTGANTLLISSEEWDNYDYASGHKEFIAVNLGEAHLEAKDGAPAGYIKLELGHARVELDGTQNPDDIIVSSFESEVSFYLYLNDDVVSYEFKAGDQVDGFNGNINEMAVELLGSMLGATEEELGSLIYTYDELLAVVPQVVNLCIALTDATSVSTEYLEEYARILALAGNGLINKTTYANGNVTYSSDVTSLKHLTELMNGKTVSQYIDLMYGEGTANKVKSFLTTMFDKTVKDIANSAIAFAENYEVDINAIFEFIDLYVYMVSGTQINVRYELQHNIDLSIGDILTTGMEDSEKQAKLDELKAGVNKFVNECFDIQISALYNLIVFGDADHKGSDGKAYNVFDEFGKLLDQLQDEAHFGFTFDAEGNFVAGIVEISDYLLSIDKTDDGFKAVITYSEDDSGYVELNVTENLITLVGYAKNEKILDGYFKTTEVEPGVVNGEADLKVGDFDCIDLSFTQKDGVYTDLHFVFMIEQSEYETVYNEATGTYEEVFVSTYSYEAIKIDLTTGEGYESFALEIDDLSFTSLCEYTDNSATTVYELKMNTSVIKLTTSYTDVVVGEDTYTTETAKLECDGRESFSYEGFRTNGVLESIDVTTSVRANTLDTPGLVMPDIGVEENEDTLPFTLTEEEEEEEEKYITLKLSWSKDSEGNGHASFTSIDADGNTSFFELRTQTTDAGVIYTLVIADENEDILNISLGFEEIENGVKISLDLPKILSSTDVRYATSDNENVEIFNVYNYLEAHAEIIITHK